MPKQTKYANVYWDELNKMEYSDFKKVASHMIKMANQRARRLEAYSQKHPDFYSPELEVFRDRKKPFTTRGKDLNALKSEYKNVLRFMNARTSTIKGTRVYNKMVQQKLNLNTNDKKYISNFWDNVHKLNSTPQFREWLARNNFKYADVNVIKFIQKVEDNGMYQGSTLFEKVINAIEKQNASMDMYKEVQEDGGMWF